MYSLADDLKDAPLYQLVKNIISKFTISSVPPYIITGKRYTSVTHDRLRNNCSSLNNDFLEIMFVITLYVICVV